MKKNNGFTLIELLAVIIILAGIALVAFPILLNTIKNSEGKIDSATRKLVVSAASLYIDNNLNDYQKHSDAKYCVSIDTLVENNFLNKSIVEQNKSLETNNMVNVNYDSKKSKFKYEIVDSCSICEATTGSTKTTGNVPTGEYKVGDEYICEVGPNMSYHFFVVSTEDDKVNLLMDSNVDVEGNPIKTELEDYKNYVLSWITKDDYIAAGGTEVDYGTTGNNSKGPLSLINYLKQSTKSWTNINSQTFVYSDNNYSVTTENNARLPKLDELKSAGCEMHEIDGTLDGLATCPLWAVNYLGRPAGYSNISGVDFSKYENRTNAYAIGYWLMHSNPIYQDRAYVIGHYGDIDGDKDSQIKNWKGVRPVISIDKKLIKNN